VEGAKLGLKLELRQRLRLREYHNGDGDFHFHSQIEICYVTGGEVDVLVNDRMKRLKKGELSIALAYDTHRYLPVGDAYFIVLIVPPDICREFEAMLNGRTVSNPFITEKEAAEKIGACIREIRTYMHTDDVFLTKGELYLILGVIAQNVSFEEGASNTGSDLVSKILLYVHEHYKEDISLSSIAAHFGYNASYVSGLFKSSINLGILRYINLLRLKNVVTLLQNREYSTEFCALESGFRSVRTFYRTFREVFGCSPKEYLQK
jgi:Response regulator containing CheY-like receiver domain and AraC-type DNA-binding domain